MTCPQKRVNSSTLAVRTYDLDGRINQVDSSGLRTYTWDDADRITGIVDAQNSSLNQGYGYDDLDRLTSVTKASGNQSFTYDSNGNRLTYVDGGASSAYTMAGTSNRLSSISGSQARTYSYNAVGAVTGDGSKTFAYSDRERMKSATIAGSTWNYYHNGLGERVRKELAPSGNQYYVYDEAGHLIGEYDGNTLIQETVWLGDIPVATVRGSSIFYVHTDHLTAPRMVTQPSNNAIRWRWDRDPFGTTVVNENPSGLGVFSYNLRLPGQFYDAETGLNYNYFRDYDPAIGRYVQSDPIGLDGGFSTYGYANQNPIAFSDPLGLKPYEFQIRIGGGVGHIIFGGSLYTATIRDVEEGKTCDYQIRCGGIGVGLPEFGVSSRPVEFDDGRPCSECKDFEGVGYIGGVSAQVGIGGTVGGGIKIPNGPFIANEYLGWDRGAVRVDVSHNVCYFKFKN